ncbi:MAG: hypothetical protein ACI8S6_002529 [Myxococcota bacterium]|jgi:hypothetical protein
MLALLVVVIVAGLTGASLATLSAGLLRHRNPMSPRVWWILVTLSVGRFWLLDLHAARFQVVLVLIPTGVALGHAIRQDVLGRLVGGIGALAMVWVLLYQRMEGTGCSGVSQAYEETLLVLFGLILIAAPSAVVHARCDPATGAR